MDDLFPRTNTISVIYILWESDGHHDQALSSGGQWLLAHAKWLISQIDKLSSSHCVSVSKGQNSYFLGTISAPKLALLTLVGEIFDSFKF
jgi:hypothetical protein